MLTGDLCPKYYVNFKNAIYTASDYCIGIIMNCSNKIPVNENHKNGYLWVLPKTLWLKWVGSYGFFPSVVIYYTHSARRGDMACIRGMDLERERSCWGDDDD